MQNSEMHLKKWGMQRELLFWGKGIFGQYKPKEKDFGKHHGGLGVSQVEQW